MRVLRVFRAVALALLLPGLTTLAVTTPASAGSATFGAVTTRVEITPNALGFPDYYRAGYGGSAPVHVTGGLPLYATGLLIVNSAGDKWVMISADLLGLPTAMTDMLQSTAQTQYGIPPERMMIGTTHTHSGPVLIEQPNTFITYNIAPGSAADQRVQAYTSAVETKLLTMIATMIAATPTPVTAAFATGVANGAVNRSSGRPTVVEPSVPVLTLRAASDQKIVAVVFSYATHAVSAGQINTWSGDYPAVAEQAIESQLAAANPGVKALYLRGASGDLDPKGNLTPTTLGNMIATQVVTATAGGPGTGSAAVTEPEAAAYQDVSAPLDIRVTDAALRAHYAAVLASPPSQNDLNHAQVMINQIDAGTLRRAMKVQVTTWRFGAPAGIQPLGLIAIAGEALADYSIGFQTVLSNSYRAWFVTQTNGHPGYLPPDEVLARGDGCPTPASACFYRDYEAGWASVDAGQRYPLSSGITFNDGLPAPLQAGTDNLLCQRATALLTGTAADCTNFTPGRVIPHAALANTGPAFADWTDTAGHNHLELLALGTDGCLRHRAWTGGGNGSLVGTWSAWDTPICGGIVGPPSAEAWTDSAGAAHIELAVRTSDGSLFHGRCAGDTSGCFGKTWTWTQIATPALGFVEQPELSVWQQQNGVLRIDAYAVKSVGRCLDHLGFVGTDTLGNGAWNGAWTESPGCGGILGPAAASSWRGTGTALNHDVVVRTTDGSLYTVRCAGTETSCTWGAWQAITKPAGVNVADSPTYRTAPSNAGPRSDLYIRGSDNCVYQAGWTTPTMPTSPTWRKLGGCGVTGRIGATDFQDGNGRSRTEVVAMNNSTNGPLWFRQTASIPGTFAGDVVGDWEDIADPTAAISNP
jgi:hypothetical protein